ncbi:MAG: Fic family protein [Thermoplasmatota archaeon]
MTYTETKVRNGRSYHYRTMSTRVEGKVRKKRIYLGRDLPPELLERLESEADLKLSDPDGLLESDELDKLNAIARRYREHPSDTHDIRHMDFLIRFTHDSTAIEGNTLTLGETRSLIVDGITPSSKAMREIHEVIGHGKAFDRMFHHKGKMERKWLSELHTILMENILGTGPGEKAGRYRRVNVALKGSNVEFPHYSTVPERMRDLLSWYNRKSGTLHPLIAAARFHVEFEVIHPYTDGNGRLGRLLMNQILHERDFPMVNIPKRNKVEYFLSLRKAHESGDMRPFIELLIHLLQTHSSDLKV